MLKTVFSTTLAVMLTVSTGAFAQSTASDSATTEETTGVTGQDSSAAEIESQLDLGQDADAPSEELGKPYTKEEIGAWELRCIKTEQEEDPCQLYQLLDNGEGVPVAEFSLFRLPEGGKAVAGATIIVPLETALPNQLTITIDGGKAKRYPYAFCNPIGCYARIGLTSADVAGYKRGNKAVLKLVPALALDQEIELELSLDGFTAGFDKASVLKQ